jgi:hypothetical protein
MILHPGMILHREAIPRDGVILLRRRASRASLMRRSSERKTGDERDAVTGRQGDVETWRRGDAETGRQGDVEKLNE